MRWRGWGRPPGEGGQGPNRVAFVSQPVNPIIPANDAVGVVTCEIAKRLTTSFDVVVYGVHWGARKTTVCRDGVEFHLLPARFDHLWNRLLAKLRTHHPKPRPRKPFFESFPFFLVFAVRVAVEIRRRRFHIVHIQTFSHFVPIVRALNPRTKIVLHMHCEWLSQLDGPMVARRLRKLDLVVGCSDHVSGKVRDAFPLVAPRCVTVYNGLAPTWFDSQDPSSPPRGETRRLLFVSRVSPEKGVHVLLEAFEEIAASDPDVCLEIVGGDNSIPAAFIVDLSDEQKVQALSSFYGRDDSYYVQMRGRVPPGIEDRVTFAGFVLPDSMRERYRDAELLVHPSLSDAAPMSLAEAMASGLPVVATRVGGIPEIVEDGRTGILVESDDAEALAAAVLELLHDRERAALMGRTGQARAGELFTWERTVETLEAEYARLLGPDHRGRPPGHDHRRG